MKRAAISLCMIVRDEEAMLPDCLASVRGAVDEMIVVDTGSRDATRDLAAKAGARVLDFEWIDDFAAARNHGLAHATGQWVLVLDADERLTPRSAHGLRRAAARGTFDCGMLRLHEASRVGSCADDVVSGKARFGEIQLVPRLLRRTDGLSFTSAIHENVLPWLRRRGMKVASVDADILHLGATKEVVAQKDKLTRNVRLLRGRIERAPNDIEAYGYLAHEYLRADCEEEAFQVVSDGWALVPLADQTISLHRIATARAHLLIGRRMYAEARQAVETARRIDGDSPDLAFYAAYAAESEAMQAAPGERRKLLGEAGEGYRRCLSFGTKVFAQSFVIGASSWYAATRLGTVLLLLGQPHEAEVAFAGVLSARPTDRAPSLGRVEAKIAAGDATAGLALVEGLLDDRPDGWTLAALAAEAIGRSQDARLFVRRATECAPKGFVAVHRREILQGLLHRLAA